MTYNKTKQIFDAQKIIGWKITGKIGDKETGQALVAEVTRLSDGVVGVFRVLNEKRRSDTNIARFKREIRVLTDPKNAHPSIVKILDHSDDGLWYISEKGSSFKEYWNTIKTTNSENPDKIVIAAIDCIGQLADGLIKLHAQKVVHRDIKPDNIVIKDEHPVLIDFGVVFVPDEERITPVDSAVGNARFSPDQMMNRLEEIPPWLDIFQLSQVLIWMVSDSPNKNWSRPLDWRWVIYPQAISEHLVLAIRAVTAICSDPELSPKNALDLKRLLSNLFSNSSHHSEHSIEVKEILQSISSGKAKSLIQGSSDQSTLSSSLILFANFFNVVENHIKNLHKIGNGSLPIKLIEANNFEEWIDTIKSTKKFRDNPYCYPIGLNCGEFGQPQFEISLQVTFWVPSLLTKHGINELPPEFLPFSAELGVASSHRNFFGKRMFIAMDRSGDLWYSPNIRAFREERQIIKLADILSELTNWVQNKVYWETINS